MAELSTNQVFVIEVLKLIVPLFSAVIGYFAMREANRAYHQSRIVHNDLKQVQKQLDGQVTQKIQESNRQINALIEARRKLTNVVVNRAEKSR